MTRLSDSHAFFQSIPDRRDDRADPLLDDAARLQPVVNAGNAFADLSWTLNWIAIPHLRRQLSEDLRWDYLGMPHSIWLRYVQSHISNGVRYTMARRRVKRWASKIAYYYHHTILWNSLKKQAFRLA
jgi:hypothetical protein